ncbi:MAG: SpoIID/LytB domain-containing protein [Endomicrobium sp.]|jgi:stage II sporulation protein D|nr:SpoIID/LytB domain-containing protein [Endomicrobium sp.]
MKIRLLFKIIILIALFCFSNSYAFDMDQENIKIGIILDVSSFTTGSSKYFFVSDSSNKKFKITRGTINIACSKKGIRIGKYDLSLPVKIKPSNGAIFANSKPYRGYILLIKSGKKINVINVLNIEDYVKGVLPKEVNSGWPKEALKVQAVISRTYAIANLNSHSTQGFDLCSMTHCQVYGGLGVETESSNQAVLETKWEILTFEGRPAQTVFHATCAGHTEDPKYIWGWEETPPYLKGVKCPYCSNSPYARWEESLDEKGIRANLNLKDINIGKIKKINIKRKTPSGAAKEVEIIHSNGKCVLNAYKFRLTIDAWKIKSHFFDYIKVKDNKIFFKGKGWGHKAGLCQYGAKGMAEKRKHYTKILRHFYPGTKIETVNFK